MGVCRCNGETCKCVLGCFGARWCCGVDGRRKVGVIRLGRVALLVLIGRVVVMKDSGVIRLGRVMLLELKKVMLMMLGWC